MGLIQSTIAPKISREKQAFLLKIPTEGQVVGLRWEHSNPQGPKGDVTRERQRGGEKVTLRKRGSDFMKRPDTPRRHLAHKKRPTPLGPP